MDQFHLMQVFVAIGDQGSFAGAARHLDISPAAVTRAITALELQLGVQLIERTTRNIRLTEAGQQYLENCRPILEQVRQVNDDAANLGTSPSGSLSVTAPTLFGKALVLPCILAYMKQYPQVDVSAFFQDRLVNLMDEGIDVAVRIGHLPDSGLKAIRIGSVRKVLCASPAYLQQHGTPRHPGELKQHAVIAASSAAPRVDWRFDSADVRLKPRFVATSNDVAAAAAESGIGIARFHLYQVIEQIAAGRLAIVLSDHEEDAWPIHIVHRERHHRSPKVKAFVDMLVEHLRNHPGVT
ncbi:LysR family transcriptional regulator [Pseudomonas sp. S31]|uniref:LysR family transcriptional regulator n=1 Tax=Pseudomonas sp. S31 TaxID=1564473 RepID=UPI001912E694|nr:LysR family transcriptional regulator [Pseudomonas sp. S31]MBK5001840.1 LysR family transcriptional regulator [Pseudomonas sp. S31]